MNKTEAAKKIQAAFRKRRTGAAKKIQRAFRTWSKRNFITNNRIGSKPYALWNRSGKGHYNAYTLNTLNKLKNNPSSRRPKKAINVIMRGGLHRVRVAPLKNTKNKNNINNSNEFWNRILQVRPVTTTGNSRNYSRYNRNSNRYNVD